MNNELVARSQSLKFFGFVLIGAVFFPAGRQDDVERRHHDHDDDSGQALADHVEESRSRQRQQEVPDGSQQERASGPDQEDCW